MPRAHAAQARAERPSLKADVPAPVPEEPPSVAPASAKSGRRRGRRPAINVTRTWEIAAELEAILGSGFQLFHTRRLGWLLRQMESWPTPDGKSRLVFVDIDEAPDGQLGALLVRHQQRQYGHREA